MKRLLIYSDCFVFSGSENVIENILHSNEIRKEYQLLFHYADSETYRAAVEQKFENVPDIKPVGIKSAYNKWGYKAKLKTENNINSIYISLRYFISRFFQKIGFHDIYNLFCLYVSFREASPDLLYINNGGYPGARSCRIAVISAKLAGIKKIAFNVNNLASPPTGTVDKWLDTYINHHTDVFITASKAAGRQLMELRKFYPVKCINIPNTLTKPNETSIHSLQGRLRREMNTKQEIILGSVGLLTYRKGFHVLLDAISLICKENLPLTFKVFVFGEGEERLALENKIQELGLADTVFLPGFRENILEYVKDFDIFVCSSVSNEDFPYVIIEAMLLGKPVVGTNIAGIPEQVIDGKNGFIVPSNDPASLAKALSQLITDKEKMKEMGQNGLERYLQCFRNSQIMTRYAQLFDTMLIQK